MNSFSTRLMTNEDWPTIKFFKKEEFIYPEKMGFEFVCLLDKIRDKAGVQMVISSSYRTKQHNQEVKGAKESAHCDIPCEAVDIKKHPKDSSDINWNLARFRIVQAALSLGVTRLGVYANGSLHLDKSQARPQNRIWIKV